jgi:hypothetical protein
VFQKQLSHHVTLTHRSTRPPLCAKPYGRGIQKNQLPAARHAPPFTLTITQRVFSSASTRSFEPGRGMMGLVAGVAVMIGGQKHNI